MNIETLRNANYEKLSVNDREILQQIMTHQEAYQNYSSEQLALACHISRATLLRLCRKIGLSSFFDLKYLMKRQPTHEIAESYDFHTVCEDYHLLLHELEKISFQPVCERIHQAQTVYIYGTGNEQKSMAEELKRIFLSVGKCVIDLFDKGEVECLKASFQSDELFIIISLSGETQEGIDIIKSVQHCIHTVSLTRLQNNTISSLCEAQLYVATQKLNGITTESYELVGVFYALLDLLFVNYIAYLRQYHQEDKIGGDMDAC